MQHHQRLAAAKGLLYSVVVALVPYVSAMALAFTPGQAVALLLREPRNSQPGPNQPDQSKPDSEQPGGSQQGGKAVVVTGTIVKSGSYFVLQDSTGTVYSLDTPENAQPFDGKSVKVTGMLEVDTNLLHVKSIETVTA
jgi:hypothetical protein